MRWARISFVFVLLAATLSGYAPINALGQSFGAASPVSMPLAVAASIPLRQGWNLVASPLTPSDPAAASVFASIAGLFDVAYAYDACDTADPWKKYDPKAPAIASDLTIVSAARGLWIKASADTTWIVSGTTPIQVDISLCAGQNLISYPSVGSAALPDALAGIAGKYSKVYAFDSADASDPWKIFDPQAPAFVNDLTALGPTRGYWIDMKTAATLTVGSPVGAFPKSERAILRRRRELLRDGDLLVRPDHSHRELCRCAHGLQPGQARRQRGCLRSSLWYDTSPSAADLTAWDAVTIYLSLDGGPGSALERQHLSLRRATELVGGARRGGRLSTGTTAQPGMPPPSLRDCQRLARRRAQHK